MFFKKKDKSNKKSGGATVFLDLPQLSEASLCASAPFPIGSRVRAPHVGEGVLAWYGAIKTSDASDIRGRGYWMGIRLDAPVGKCDGSFDGVPYFQAPPQHGMFVRPDFVALVSAAVAQPSKPPSRSSFAGDGVTPSPSSPSSPSSSSSPVSPAPAAMLLAASPPPARRNTVGPMSPMVVSPPVVVPARAIVDSPLRRATAAPPVTLVSAPSPPPRSPQGLSADQLPLDADEAVPSALPPRTVNDVASGVPPPPPPPPPRSPRAPFDTAPLPPPRSANASITTAEIPPPPPRSPRMAAALVAPAPPPRSDSDSETSVSSRHLLLQRRSTGASLATAKRCGSGDSSPSSPKSAASAASSLADSPREGADAAAASGAPVDAIRLARPPILLVRPDELLLQRRNTATGVL